MSSEEVLRSFLKKQAEAEYDDLKMRLDSLRGEADDIQKHLTSFEDAARHLSDISSQYVAKAEEE